MLLKGEYGGQVIVIGIFPRLGHEEDQPWKLLDEEYSVSFVHFSEENLRDVHTPDLQEARRQLQKIIKEYRIRVVVLVGYHLAIYYYGKKKVDYGVVETIRHPRSSRITDVFVLPGTRKGVKTPKTEIRRYTH